MKVFSLEQIVSDDGTCTGCAFRRFLMCLDVATTFGGQGCVLEGKVYKLTSVVE